MTAEVELFQPRPPAMIAAQQAQLAASADDIDSWVIIASDVIKLSSYICETEFVPKNYRDNPHATAAAILAGRELGLPPFTALRHVHLVEGSPSLSAEYKRARVLAAGHELDILELTTTRCRVAGRRRNSGKPPLEITFTIEDAKRAGIYKARGSWETRPRRMLFARASTEVCDFLFADVTNGLPTTELVEAGEVDEFGGYAESPSQAAPAPAGQANGQAKPGTAQRASRRRQADKPGPTSAAGAAGASPPAASATGQAAPDGTSPDLPPLPGEDVADAAGEDENDIDKDAPGSVSKPQLTKLGAIFTEYGFKAAERQQRLTVASQITGRELDSSADLSLNEARALIDTLESCGSRDNLVALLAASERQDADGEAAE